MRAGGVALDSDCREGGTFAFSAIIFQDLLLHL